LVHFIWHIGKLKGDNIRTSFWFLQFYLLDWQVPKAVWFIRWAIY